MNDNLDTAPEVPDSLLSVLLELFTGKIPSLGTPPEATLAETYRRQGEQRVINKIKEWHKANSGEAEGYTDVLIR